MTKEKAKINFLGQSQHGKLNCAQAVVLAFKDKFFIRSEALKQFEKCGGGNAPDGFCGALFAAKVFLEKYPDKFKELQDSFRKVAESDKCKEIRQVRKLTCLGCVEKAAEFLEKIIP